MDATEANSTAKYSQLKRPGRPKVEPPPASQLDVAAIRKGARSVGATQESFANAIGVPVKTLRNWEQGRRHPTGPARVLLMLVQRDPWVVFDVMKDQHRTPAT